MTNAHNPSKSLEESLKEMKLMRQGKKPKKSWDDMVSEIKSSTEDGGRVYMHKDMKNILQENMKSQSLTAEDLKKECVKEIPHLNLENGRVIIDDSDPLQVDFWNKFKEKI